MARLRGRAPRGERCRSGVPHGNWKTTTVIRHAIILFRMTPIASLIHFARSFGIVPASFLEGLEAVPSSKDAEAAVRAREDGSRFPDRQLTRSITRQRLLTRHLVNELVLAIEQSQTRRPPRNPAPSMIRSDA